MAMKTVFIESPFRHADPALHEANIKYAQAAMRYAIAEGFAPIAPHLMWPGVMDDNDANEREAALKMCRTVRDQCNEVWFCIDLGMSEGMHRGTEEAFHSKSFIVSLEADERKWINGKLEGFRGPRRTPILKAPNAWLLELVVNHKHRSILGEHAKQAPPSPYNDLRGLAQRESLITPTPVPLSGIEHNIDTGEVTRSKTDHAEMAGGFIADPDKEARRAAEPKTTMMQIIAECDAIKAMLIEKNRKYGDSALEPRRIFSKASPVEQIKVRIDDKLSRLKAAQIDEDEDVTKDLIGYLILLRIALARQ